METMRKIGGITKMTLFHKKAACILCAAAAVLTLSACGNRAATQINTPTHAATAPTETTIPIEEVESLTVVMKAGELYTLEHYPNLKTVDLSGSTCYDSLLSFTEEHPNLDITYTVDMGGAAISNKATSAALNPGEFVYETLLENLQYLPALISISLPDVSLNAEQNAALRETYPGVTLSYTVEFFGSTLDVTSTELDLTALDSASVDAACQKLGLLTNLQNVQLSESLSMEDVAKLQNSCPSATFHYTFSLFGKTLSTTDTEVEYKNQTIGNEGEAELRKALAILDNCTRFVLDGCGFDNEVLAQIREDFRDGPKVVWRVYYGVTNRYTNLTDDEMLRAVYNVTDETCGPMKYCEDVKYMDIGHNDTLTDLSFIGYMPNIEVVIASGCAATELPGFDNCKKLTWLELANCGKLENIDTLSGCESLRFLNLSYTKVSNYMALDGLPLERFMCLSPKASKDERNTFKSIHEDCLTVFSNPYGGTSPYGYGWRYDDNGRTFNEYYKTVVREAFNYDYLESLLPD